MKRAFLLAIQLSFLLQLIAQSGSESNTTERQEVTETSEIVELISKAIEIGRQDSSAADKVFRSAIKKARQSNDLAVNEITDKS